MVGGWRRALRCVLGVASFALVVANPQVRADETDDGRPAWLGSTSGTSLADHVEAAARVRDTTVTASAPAGGSPVTALVHAAEQADGLRRQAIAGTSADDWAQARAALPAIADLLPTEITGPEDVRFDDAAMAAVLDATRALDVDQTLMAQAAADVAAAMDAVVLAAAAGQPVLAPPGTSSLGAVVVDDGSDGTCDDVYDESVFIVIDTCGNDVYHAPAGGADGLGAVPIAIVIDTAGNDHAVEGGWQSGDVPSVGAASNGGIALFVDTSGHDRWGTGAGSHIGGSGLLGGFGLMLDAAGDDQWMASGFLSAGGKFGAGHFAGSGVLIDVEGDDQYSGDTFQQGSGWFGDSLGLLVDLAGNDSYSDISTYAQGSGGVGGTGLLYDGAGDDRYVAGSVFEQGGAACGGIGLLVDRSGDDVYDEPAGYSQGMAATGLAATGCGDEAGGGLGDRVAGLLPPELRELLDVGLVDDALTTLPLGAVGVLADGAGDDRYSSGWYGQAVHVGNAAGLLLDAGGADVYSATHCGQASGSGISGPCSMGVSSPGVAALVDAAGNDRYEQYSWTSDTGQGAGYGGSIVLLWDGSGTDTYSSSARDGGGFQQRGESGLVIDLLPPSSQGYETPVAPGIDPGEPGTADALSPPGLEQLCWIGLDTWGCGWEHSSPAGVSAGGYLLQDDLFRFTDRREAVTLVMDGSAMTAGLRISFDDGCHVALAYRATTTEYSDGGSHSTSGGATGSGCAAPIGPALPASALRWN